MAAREIHPAEWPEFLDQFSDRHRGWRVDIEVRDDGSGFQVTARGLPLAGVSAEWKGSEAPAIEIMTGENGEGHVTHVVAAPTRVRFLETEDGAHEGLEIASRDGPTTVVRFRPPRQPEPAYVL